MKQTIKVFFYIAVIMCGATSFMAAMLYYTGIKHQAAAVSFWGEQYQPQNDTISVDWGFIGNRIVPTGGPLVSHVFLDVCADTPLPLVPVRIVGENEMAVMCGMGSDSFTVNLYISDIKDEELRYALKSAIKED